MRFDPTDTIVQVAHDEQRKRFGSWKANISAKDFRRIDWRAIDSRPAEPLRAEDADWGEQDSLANVPRAKQPAWVRAAALDDSEQGDR